MVADMQGRRRRHVVPEARQCCCSLRGSGCERRGILPAGADQRGGTLGSRTDKTVARRGNRRRAPSLRSSRAGVHG